MKRIVLYSLADALALFAFHAKADEHAMFTGGIDSQALMNEKTKLTTLNPGGNVA